MNEILAAVSALGGNFDEIDDSSYKFQNFIKSCKNQDLRALEFWPVTAKKFQKIVKICKNFANL